MMLAVKQNPVVELEYPAEPRVVHDVRRKFDDFACLLGIPRDDIEALKVALSEACSNAICHGSPLHERNRVWVRFQVKGERLEIEIQDEGSGFRPGRIALPQREEYKPSGRGLFIMEALLDEVRFDANATGTCVHMVKQLPTAAPREAAGAELMSEPHTTYSRLQPAVYHDRA